MSRSFRLVLLLTVWLLLANAGAPNISAKRSPRARTVGVNGLQFRIPSGYVAVLPKSKDDPAFLYYKKYQLGIAVAVPEQPFDETELVGQLTDTAINKFFPAAQATLEWKQLGQHRRISKFESGGAQKMGFNGTDLFIAHSHRIKFASKDIILLDVFKWTDGDPREVFERGLGPESMEACNDKVEILYAVTHEKINGANSPCELIAIPD